MLAMNQYRTNNYAYVDPRTTGHLFEAEAESESDIVT